MELEGAGAPSPPSASAPGYIYMKRITVSVGEQLPFCFYFDFSVKIVSIYLPLYYGKLRVVLRGLSAWNATFT